MSDNIEALEVLENDEATSKASRESRSRREKDLQLLESIAGGLELFKGTDDTEYALLPNDGGRATAVYSRNLKNWLGSETYGRDENPVQPVTMDEFLDRLAARARFGGDERSVHVRVALKDTEVWLDLGGNEPSFVHVTPTGWSVLSNSPIAFKKSPQTRELPRPVHGGSVDELRPFVNAGSDEDFMLMVGWAIGVLVDDGPVPILALQGQQGSAKSTTAKVLARLLDDSASPLRAYPHDTDSLFIAATSRRVLAFDNLSRLSGERADDLCRIATGIATGKRRLYTDGEEHVIQTRNPVILNGIDTLAERPDLVSRTIVIELPAIPDIDRLPEREFWDRFEAARPRVLGAALDVVAAVLKNWDTTYAPNGARMADFVAHVTAAEDYLGWLEGSFADAYTSNQENSNQVALDSDPLSQALLDYMGSRTTGTVVEHTATQWCEKLEPHWPDRKKAFPGNAQMLSNRLKRLAPALRDIGVKVEWAKLTDRIRTRVIRVSCDEPAPVRELGKDMSAYEAMARLDLRKPPKGPAERTAQ